MSQQFTYAHEVAVRLGAGGDPAAVGAAVTVGLCGHWEHEPPCRWPHHTEAVPDGLAHRVRVDFDCAPDEEADVRRLIVSALASGSLTVPGKPTTRWELIAQE